MNTNNQLTKQEIISKLKAELISSNPSDDINEAIKDIKRVDNTANIKELILLANNGDAIKSARVIKASFEAQKALDSKDISSLAYNIETQLKKNGLPEGFSSLKECLNSLKINFPNTEEDFFQLSLNRFNHELSISFDRYGNDKYLLEVYGARLAFKDALKEIVQGNNVDLEILDNKFSEIHFTLLYKNIAKTTVEYNVTIKFNSFNAALDEIASSNTQSNSLASLAFKGVLNKIAQDNVIDTESLFKGSESEVIIRKANTLSSFIENTDIILTSQEVEAKEALSFALNGVLGEVSHQE
jgi:hypothetical protein